MKTLPKISIIIPVYNVAEYITECVQSVMRQTYQGEIECILVDDCGSDGSIAIAEQLIAEYKGSISFRILHHDHNRGLSAARNTGLEASTGDYVYFLDSDDFIDANTIEVLYEAVTSRDYAISISYFTKYTEKGDAIYCNDWLFDAPRIIEPGEYADKILMQQCNFASTAKLYDKKKMLSTIRFVEGKLNEDTIFAIDTISIVESNHFRCIELPLYSYHYRMREESICHKSTYKMDTAYIENIQIAIDRYRDRTELVDWLKKDQLNRCIKVVRDKETDKKCYLTVGRYMRYISNHYIKQNRSFKAYIHLLLIKYLPIVMWHVEHK